MALRQSEKTRVVVLDDWDGIAIESPALRRLQTVAEVVTLERGSEEQVVQAAAAAATIIPMRERRAITSELIRRLPGLRHIAQTGGSTAHIDLKAAHRAGIHISVTPGVSATSVAELAISLIIASRRGTAREISELKGGRWERPLGRELRGATLGIVGWGSTGKRLGHLAKAFDMNVIVHSRRPRGEDLTGFSVVELDDLFELADIVSLHVELSDATRGLITQAHLKKLGPSGLLVNTARAQLVKRDELLAALDMGELGGAALDVFHVEPPESGDALVNHELVVATPHLGWRTHTVMESYLDAAVDNIMHWLNQEQKEGSTSN